MPACKLSSKIIPAVFAWTMLICCTAIFFACAYVTHFVHCYGTDCICTLLICTSSEPRHTITNPHFAAVFVLLCSEVLHCCSDSARALNLFSHLLYAGLSGTITEDFAIRRTTYIVGLPIKYKTIFDSSFIKTADETQCEYNEM